MSTEPEASARPRRGTQDRRSHRPAVRAAALYGLFGAIWVFASDRLVDLVLHGPRLRSTAQTVKGWAFVGISAAFVFAFVAARGRAEQELLRARANLDDAERVGRVGSWVLDGRSRRFTLSQGACLALGLPSGERPTVATIFGLVHPDDRGPAREWVEQALAGQAPDAMDLRIPRPGGPPRVVQIRGGPEVDESGAVVRVIGTVQDVTERERLEERLRALRAIDREILGSHSADEVIRTALLRLLALAAADRGSVARLDPDRDVLRVYDVEDYHVEDDGSARLGPGIEIPSAAMGETLGALTRGEVVLISDIRGRVRSVPALAVLAEQGFRSSVSAPIRVDGRLLGVLSLLARRMGAFDEELGAVVLEVADQLAVALVQADLREELARHAEELERRGAERTAELAERNVQLEAFSAAVAHDLRAPLRAISGFGRALLQDATLPAEARRDVERIVAAAARLDHLIDELLTYSRLSVQAIPRTPVRLDDAVQAALEQVADDVERQSAEIEVVGPLPSVLGHRSTLIEVIANLLGNAVKFVAPGTRPRVRVSAEVREGRVRLSVADNGIGIPPQERERIFEPLVRLHGRETYTGTGIGLAIVRMGVERMGGRVGVEDRPGGGSTFWVELEGAADPADGDRDEGAPAAGVEDA